MMQGETVGYTYSADEDLVALLDVDFARFVADGQVRLGLTEGAKSAEETESLQTVAGQLVIGLRSILLGQTVNLREMLLAFRQVVVDDVGEHASLVVDHGDGGGDDLGVGDIGDTEARVEQLLDQLVAVLLQHIVIVAEAVNDGRQEAGVTDRLDMALNGVA